MKKILLIIAITLIIFQIVVLATAIDVGSAATNRGGLSTAVYTWVSRDNPANETGKITSVEIWSYNNLTLCEVAIFFVVSGDNLSTRDTQVIGAVTGGAKRTFEVDLNVEAGDYIGIFAASGNLEFDYSGGAGAWNSNADRIPCTNQYFSVNAACIISLYGTGETEEEEEEANAIFFGTNF